MLEDCHDKCCVFEDLFALYFLLFSGPVCLDLAMSDVSSLIVT